MKPDNITLFNVVVTACFFGALIVLGCGFVALVLWKDGAFRRRWYPRYIILVGGLFVFVFTTIVVHESPPSEALGVVVLVVPVFSLLCYLNIKMTKFCHRCGATVNNHSWFSPARFCSKCGAELDPKPPKPDTDLLE